MNNQVLLPHLFRTEYRKMVSVLCYLFGIEHVEIAEDLVSDTFLSATELWSVKGVPENPTAWLYTVAKNKTKNYLKRNNLLEQKLAVLTYTNSHIEEIDIDFSHKNIVDSQLAMIFTVCNPIISEESQIALALNLLCGFGIQEVADAFLTNKDVVYKRLQRAKEKLRASGIKIGQPSALDITNRLDLVIKTIYLLFSEGYYSVAQEETLRKELCDEAMRLTQLLIENETTNHPSVNALFALMCFHASRFAARTNENGEMILYQDQNDSLWDKQLIEKGIVFLNKAAVGSSLSRYHLEAGIAYWHTQHEDTKNKWMSILDLYNELLMLEYTTIAALNRTYALSKANSCEEAIVEAEKLKLFDNHFYHSLLGNLYTSLDNVKALYHYQQALKLANSTADKANILNSIKKLNS
ncbi:RNA polymerase sigma factor (sigma-70 family) [Pedobacter sp. UYP24]